MAQRVDFKNLTEVKDFLSFYNFMQQSRFKLIRIGSSHSIHFDRELFVHCCKSRFNSQLSVGNIHTSVVNVENLMVKQYIANKRAELNMPVGTDIPPGYYLFDVDRAISYHPGTAPPSLEKEQSLFTEIVAFLTQSAQKSSDSIGKVMAQQFESTMQHYALAPARKPKQDTGHLAEEVEADTIPPVQEPVLVMEVQQAYSLLGLAHSAERDEVNRAYKTLAKQFHPDQYRENPKIQAYAAKQFLKASQAKQLIFQHLELS